jgi:hypothetical protein
METGDWVEVFGTAHVHHAGFNRGPVIEFPDRRLGRIQRTVGGQGSAAHPLQLLVEDYAWAQFGGPDGNSYGITSERAGSLV